MEVKYGTSARISKPALAVALSPFSLVLPAAYARAPLGLFFFIFDRIHSHLDVNLKAAKEFNFLMNCKIAKNPALLAADNDIKGLNDKLEALTKQLESSTKKAIKFKTKYQNSQCAVGDIFESLKKVIVNFTDQKRTFCTSKLHTFFIALIEELDQQSKDSINSYGANVELLETLCTKAERKRQTMMCKICKEPKKGHKCPY